jgi:CRP-like cAMP-binding protein
MDRNELVRTIADSAFFHSLAHEERIQLAEVAQLFDHAEGDELFRPRQLPSALYLVVDGVVEISRQDSPEGAFEPVAYRGSGATLGESKVISGTPFNSLARFPEGGRTLQWPRPVILRKLYESRDFAMHYLQNLARRLEGSFASMGGHRGTKLGGRLDHFDLPTILQTVVDSGATGVLEIFEAEGQSFGSVFTRELHVGPIRCGSLSGSEALFEILVNPPSRGSFNFREVRRPPESDIPQKLQPLLIQAAHMQDELGRFASVVPESVRLRLTGQHPEWGQLEDRDLVDQIRHELVTDPCGWGELAERLPYSRGRVALAVRDMLASGVLAHGE